VHPVQPVHRVLLIKTSSMGDIVHTLSAVQEAAARCPQVRFDWVCEEAFIDLPALSTAVDRVIPVAIRRWRSTLLQTQTRHEIAAFIRELRAVRYDRVIDAQGLIKTAWITRLAKTEPAARWGYDWSSARERWAAWATSGHVRAPQQWHAIERLRILFSQALGYPLRGEIVCLNAPPVRSGGPDPDRSRRVMFCHGTSRREKSWPAADWSSLGIRLLDAGASEILIPWGSPEEHTRAQRIADVIGDRAQVMPASTIATLAKAVQEAWAVVGVDSGLMHLSVVLGRPTLALMTGAHHRKFRASRFAPSWASHARVIVPESADGTITVDEVAQAWADLQTSLRPDITRLITT